MISFWFIIKVRVNKFRLIQNSMHRFLKLLYWVHHLKVFICGKYHIFKMIFSKGGDPEGIREMVNLRVLGETPHFPLQFLKWQLKTRRPDGTVRGGRACFGLYSNKFVFKFQTVWDSDFLDAYEVSISFVLPYHVSNLFFEDHFEKVFFYILRLLA